MKLIAFNFFTLNTIYMKTLYYSSIFLFGISLVFMFSCTNGKANKSLDLKDRTNNTSEINEEYSLPLDAETPLWNYFSQPIILKSKPKLLWFNPTRYSIDYFDVRTQTLERKVILEQNGPNALPGIGMNSGIKYINEDTVIVFKGRLNRFSLMKASGEIYKHVNLKDYPYGFGSIDLKTSIAYRKGSIYMQQLPRYPEFLPKDFNPKYNKIAKINLSDGSVEEFEINYPAVYSDKKVPQQLKMIRLVYNEKIDKFIISYPLEEELYITDFKSKVDRHPTPSDLISESIPIDPKNESIDPSSIQSFYYWHNDAYENLIYDPQNDVYLREVRKGISEKEFIDRKFTSKREFIVLDKNFKQMGTFEFFSSGLNYYFFDGNRFFWEKDLQKFNLEDGVEDSIFFQSKVLDF
ncbi:protein of unknown function [Algoriphagus faecimaris]|uniref:DUF4221 domain-containing protein n=2 Tax=Algoriphagus faecimaris TaxID=686796 RepID=A0A1G6Q8U2_9BACT|nr:protein of unknown function [Algoriphagus faecimaris]